MIYISSQDSDDRMILAGRLWRVSGLLKGLLFKQSKTRLSDELITVMLHEKAFS